MIHHLYGQIGKRELIATDNQNTSAFKIVDINGDGLQDLDGNKDRGFFAYLNRGDFEFSIINPGKIEMDSIDILRSRLAFINNDQDNDRDLLYIGCNNCGDKNIRLLENTDGTTFTSGEIIVQHTDGFVSPEVIIEDFDNDGDEDFFVAQTTFSDLYLMYFINTLGVFDTLEIPPIEDALFYSLHANDLDGDDIPELMILIGNQLSVYKVQSDGITLLSTYNGGHPSMKKKDLNGDGLLDFYYSEGSCIKVLPVENGGIGNSYIFHCGASGDSGYYISDYEGDGDLDIYHGRGNAYGMSVRIFDQGGFQPSQKIGVAGRFITWISEIDADDDGWNDLVFNTTAEYAGILERIDAGEFGLAHTLTSSLSLEEMKALNVDADPELEVVLHQEDWIGYMDISDGVYQGYTTLFNAYEWIEDVDFKDLDKDGDEDMLVLYYGTVTSGTDTSLFWLENNGQVFSHPHLIFSDFSDAQCFITEDFDQDGDFDIALFSDFMPGRYLRNVGNGVFVMAQNLFAKTYHAKVTDINQDKWMDILTWDLNDNAYVILNNQQGGFGIPEDIGAKEFIQICDAHDYDKDGDQDIVVSYLAGGWEVFENRNNEFTIGHTGSGELGGFATVDLYDENVKGILAGYDAVFYRPFPPPNFNFGDFAYNNIPFLYRNILVADLDRSGKSELIGYSYEEGLFVHRDIETAVDFDNDGYAGMDDCNPFDPLINSGAEEIPDNTIDENCDGLVEINDNDGDGYGATVDCNDADPDVHPNAEEIPLNGIDEDCDGFDYVDFDQDGYPAHVDCNDFNGNVHPGAYDNPGDGFDEDCDGADAISYFTHRTRKTLTSKVTDVDAVDIDNDGVMNLMYVSNNAIGWLTYPFTAGLPSGILETDESAEFIQAEAGDFDKDGDMDVVAFGADRSVDYFENTGNGLFTDAVVIRDHGVNIYASSLEVGDIDGDENLDVVTDIGGHIYIFYGDGLGGFTTDKPFELGTAGLSSIELYNIDEDQDMELFVTSYNEGIGAHWYKNDGNREFSERKPICPGCVWAGQIYFDDYDQDDKEELILLVNASNPETNHHGGVKAYEWDGTLFQYEAELLEFDVLNNIYPADMDGNCMMDFIWGGINYLTMGIAYNYDSLPFLDHRMRDTSLHVYDVIAVDLTDDRNPEMILATQNKNSILVIRNDLAPHDIDGDGFVRKDDCDYCDNEIHPLANEIPGNGIDENCDGLDMITSTDLLGGQELRIFPNPSSGIVQLLLDTYLPLNIKIYNATGNLCLEKINTMSVDLSEQPAGMYWFVVTNPGTGDSVVRKVVKK